MRLWTIGSEDRLDRLEREGKLTASAAHIDHEFYGRAYKWLSAQMVQRVGSAPNGAEFPVWAWYQYRNAKAKRPDLRASAHLPKGTRGVRLELEIDPARVLLSDFSLWHSVLNDWYLPRSKRDSDRFDRELEVEGLNCRPARLLPDHFRARIEASWERVFDLEWNNRYVTAGGRDQRSIQATVWEVRLADLRRVDRFVAR